MKPVSALRLATTALAMLVAGLAALVLQPTTALADDTVGIAISPATKAGRDERSRFSFEIDPGQEISDHVWVANAGTKPLKVTIFATDAYNTEDGAYALLDTKEKPTDAGSWVSFRDGKPNVKVTLKPKQATIVAFTVRVPANAAPGDHPAGIVAAAAPAGDGQLAVERRIATRLYARVSGDLQPVLTISSFTGSYAGSINPLQGSVSSTAVISNNGNVALGGTITLDAKTWFGLGVGGSTNVELSEMLPGSTRTITFDLPDVPQAGYVQPHLLLRSAIGPDAPDPGPLPVVERETFVFAVPWTIVVLLVIGLVVWQVLRLRRRRDEARAAEWVAYTEAEAARKAGEAQPEDAALEADGPSSVDQGSNAWDAR